MDVSLARDIHFIQGFLQFQSCGDMRSQLCAADNLCAWSDCNNVCMTLHNHEVVQVEIDIPDFEWVDEKIGARVYFIGLLGIFFTLWLETKRRNLPCCGWNKTIPATSTHQRLYRKGRRLCWSKMDCDRGYLRLQALERMPCICRSSVASAEPKKSFWRCYCTIDCLSPVYWLTSPSHNAGSL